MSQLRMEPPPSALRLAAEGDTKGRFWKAVPPRRRQNLLGRSNDAFPAAVPCHRQVKEQNTAPGTLAGEGPGSELCTPRQDFYGIFCKPEGNISAHTVPRISVVICWVADARTHTGTLAPSSLPLILD